jgi:hypothetical protein
LHEWPKDSVEEIRIELTRGVELSTDEVEAALEDLRLKGYVEEFQVGHWKLAPNGHGVKRSLLGEISDAASI